ncbi:MAG: GTP 3',8-cyclase MoaA [Actinomycetota bacterium]|nr:GTP 3',8-cyclase MoaA [Actinomycetota bacterium]
MEDEKSQVKRRVDYLRLSITDRCNLRCTYCMPEKGVPPLKHEDIITYEELLFFTDVAVKNGIRKIRVTGGEPLVRKGATEFLKKLDSLSSKVRVTLTTNGVLLAEFATELKKSGVNRVNVSLDSLDPDTYRMITRVGDISRPLLGIKKAIEVGLKPVKINVVVLAGINDDPLPFVKLALEMPVHVRFIEYMPYFREKGSYYIPSSVVLERIQSFAKVEPINFEKGWGPAKYYRIRGAPGTIGLISPVSCHICDTCNRLRVTADGRLKTCLFDENGVDIKSMIRGGAKVETIRDVIRKELERKMKERNLKPEVGAYVHDHMSRIGG